MRNQKTRGARGPGPAGHAALIGLKARAHFQVLAPSLSEHEGCTGSITGSEVNLDAIAEPSAALDSGSAPTTLTRRGRTHDESAVERVEREAVFNEIAVWRQNKKAPTPAMTERPPSGHPPWRFPRRQPRMDCVANNGGHHQFNSEFRWAQQVTALHRLKMVAAGFLEGTGAIGHHVPKWWRRSKAASLANNVSLVKLANGMLGSRRWHFGLRFLTVVDPVDGGHSKSVADRAASAVVRVRDEIFDLVLQ